METIYRDIPFAYTPEAIASFVAGRSDVYDEADRETMRHMIEEAEAIACPKAKCRLVEITGRGEGWVEAGGTRLTSPLVARNLADTRRIVAYVATCGTELEEWSTQFADPLAQYWADQIKLFFLGQIRSYMTAQIRARYFPAGHMSSMNPGSLKEWPLPEQAALFRLVGEVTRDTGVRLTDSFLMLPSKSGSGFFFASGQAYENCQYCPLLDCPGRRAPYQGEPPTA